jgi:hypothetical protein
VTKAARRLLLAVSLAALAATTAGAALPERWAGEWRLVRDLGAAGISALSDEEAARLLGTTIRLRDDVAQVGDERCAAPSYEAGEETTADFLADLRLTRAELDVPGERIATLEISCAGRFFEKLYQAENGCLVAIRDGRLFAGSRAGHAGARRC